MTVSATSAATRPRLPARHALRAGGTVLGIAALANLAALGIADLAGADLLVAQTPDAEPMSIGAVLVLVTTVVPVLLGTGALAVAGRWGRRAWSALAWLGLALGIGTVVAPFTMVASAGTSTALASMHVITGVVWFVVVRRGARSS